MAVRAVCAGAARWRTMSVREKLPWQKMAEESSCRYRSQMEERERRRMLKYASELAEENILNEWAAYRGSSADDGDDDDNDDDKDIVVGL